MEVPAGYEVRHINRSTWVTPLYYQELSPIGTGAFGAVCSAVDTRTGNAVAIKKLQRPFQTKVHAQRAYREIKLLRYMDHENVIGLVDLFQATAPGGSEPDIYIITDLMGSDLHTIIQSQFVSDDHVQFLVYQVLRALVYVHSANIIHRDLKPSNIAINEDCDLKILDFGLARTTTPDGGMTGYVATRWYRAPEIMLKWGEYQKKVDLWSVGCILAELLTGQALFQGRDHVEQLNRITHLLGRPDAEFTKTIASDHARQYVQALPPNPGQSFGQYFGSIKKDISPQAVDLLERLLVFDPAKRLSAQEAIRHPYLAKFHDPEDEPLAELPFDDTFEQLDLEVDGWKALVLQEVQGYMHEAFALMAHLHQQQQLGANVLTPEQMEVLTAFLQAQMGAKAPQEGPGLVDAAMAADDGAPITAPVLSMDE